MSASALDLRTNGGMPSAATAVVSGTFLSKLFTSLSPNDNSRKLMEVLSDQPLYVKVSIFFTEQKKLLNNSALVLSVEAHEAPNLTTERIGVLPESL